MDREPRKSDWRLSIRLLDGETVWECYRLKDRYSADIETNRIYDRMAFRDRASASERCKSLNADLVQGWMADGHPMNW